MRKNLPELYPAFDVSRISSSLGEIYCRTGGEGPPVLLIHGYPQTHAIWHRVAPSIAESHRVVLVDLPGYGQSTIPPLTDDHAPYSKRSMAAALCQVMDALGHERFSVAGHDRGGRVAYRMALDHPEKVSALAVLDIVPTLDYWAKLDRVFGLKIYHWLFLAQPAPFPEDMISKDPIGFLHHKLSSWTGDKSLGAFSKDALKHYEAFFQEPGRIAATCEDYRAGATIDENHDRTSMDNAQRIAAPTLVLWGQAGIAQGTESPLQIWQNWCTKVTGHALAGGHFLAEENPDQTLEHLLPFLKSA
ncbi:alpha/beta fold hydrolase [Roseibium sp. RKSG952]|uniref:alpha/beta fold hydrolase n=1 Tax=Roseibium sp. RKSG952 TaxID=2529384 RepID=UPI0012BB88CA|nr:alpha/beta hydrolase [Roseibium sp. RKSG952]MTI00604.1 alpha/beta hydrolase [Roseibium sp. RKSG952]